MNGAPEEGSTVKREGFLKAEIFKPKGRNTFPFVVLMHGCGGMDQNARKWVAEYAAFLNHAGFGALALDSFTTRHVKESCGPPDGHWARRRSEDAYSALDYLVQSRYADPSQVYVLGRSNGGLAVLMALENVMGMDHKNKFAGGISLVPSCKDKKSASFYAPLMVFVAGNDDANEPNHCVEMAWKDRNDKPPVHVTVYKAALHGYMDHVPLHRFHGWRLGYDALAAKDTREQVLEILRTGFTDLQSGVEFKGL
jgi:dienelactone hydrolase